MPDQTPATELLAAAARLRYVLHEDGMSERIRRPWVVPTGGTYGRVVAPGQEVPVTQACWGGVAEYVATMHPGVGLALADWLESAARDAEQIGPDPFAVALARQLLGGAS